MSAPVQKALKAERLNGKKEGYGCDINSERARPMITGDKDTYVNKLASWIAAIRENVKEATAAGYAYFTIPDLRHGRSTGVLPCGAVGYRRVWRCL